MAKATMDIRVNGRVVGTLPFEAEGVVIYAPRGLVGRHGFDSQTLPRLILDLDGAAPDQNFAIESVPVDRNGKPLDMRAGLEMQSANDTDGAILRQPVVANIVGEIDPAQAAPLEGKLVPDKGNAVVVTVDTGETVAEQGNPEAEKRIKEFSVLSGNEPQDPEESNQYQEAKDYKAAAKDRDSKEEGKTAPQDKDATSEPPPATTSAKK